MKSLQRIKNYTNASIIAKIEIEIPSKSECKLFVESLTKDGDLVSTTIEKISYNEIKKIIEVFESKSKKFAWKKHTPIGFEYEVETLMFINPELMEKERVGFELYGPVSDKVANANLVAYYSFSNSEPDYRQPLVHDNIFGFFSLFNFETPHEGLKNTLNTYGVTYTDIEDLENYVIVMSTKEYERQQKNEEADETPKRKRKTKSETVKPEETNKTENTSDTIDVEPITSENTKTAVEEVIVKTSLDTNKEIQEEVIEPVKRRGRKPKEESTEIKEEKVEESVQEIAPQVVKRGRGRPPKNS